jgi:hypothetical protein
MSRAPWVTRIGKGSLCLLPKENYSEGDPLSSCCLKRRRRGLLLKVVTNRSPTGRSIKCPATMLKPLRSASEGLRQKQADPVERVWQPSLCPRRGTWMDETYKSMSQWSKGEGIRKKSFALITHFFYRTSRKGELEYAEGPNEDRGDLDGRNASMTISASNAQDRHLAERVVKITLTNHFDESSSG